MSDLMSPWNPHLYLQFGTERTQSAIDLVSRIDVPAARRVIDLGCGPGNSTAVLRRRWPEALIVGLDSDAAMLAAAEKSDSNVRWELGDAATWDPAEPFEVVFSNAMLQWVPNHAEVVPRWFRAVEPGGVLAVQIPNHYRSELHRQILEVADEPEWRDATHGARSAIGTDDAAFYYHVLSPLAERVDLWETEYHHVMNGPEDILNWIRGTGLRPFLNSLADDEQRIRFETLLLERVTHCYPRQVDGKVLFPFRRLFFVAYNGR
jgi:trans-aconitate 2-methyltransferase